MNKKANTWVFILIATVFNVVVTAGLFIGLFVLYVRLFMPLLPDGSQQWAFLVIFVLAIVLGFLVYRLAMKIFMKKVNVDDKFAPIFGNRRPRNRLD
ncbi:MAG: leader peptide processing enzyme [Spirochaetaceae bacterium]|jgi:hypothetical protein|nr:leader peptide processing enzyme [Spirochaetaceae bacterium]